MFFSGKQAGNGRNRLFLAVLSGVPTERGFPGEFAG